MINHSRNHLSTAVGFDSPPLSCSHCQSTTCIGTKSAMQMQMQPLAIEHSHYLQTGGKCSALPNFQRLLLRPFSFLTKNNKKPGGIFPPFVVVVVVSMLFFATHGNAVICFWRIVSPSPSWISGSIVVRCFCWWRCVFCL